MTKSSRLYWPDAQTAFLLANPTLTDKQIGDAIGRSANAVKHKRARLEDGGQITIRPRRRTKAAVDKFRASMAARSPAGFPVPSTTMATALAGRVFGPGASSGGPVRVLRIGYAGGSLMGCAAAMCAE